LKCETCGKILTLEVSDFFKDGTILQYYLPDHRDNYGQRCVDSYRRITGTVKLLSLKKLMGLPIENIARYTGYICGDPDLKARITEFWKPELEEFNSMYESERSEL
jgi:hypothetical protein